VKISYDPAKRAATLQNRGLDFADAAQIFAGQLAGGQAGLWRDSTRDGGLPRRSAGCDCLDAA
jgi:uncharacterized DUF497 family protein